MYFTTKQFHTWVNDENRRYESRQERAYYLRRNFARALGLNRNTMQGSTFNHRTNRYDYPNSHPLTLAECRAILREAHAALAARDNRMGEYGLSKWYRPWDVVPALKNIEAPEGDYTVGVEVEMGFLTREAAATIARQIIRWKHVTLDVEGGTYPIEATFPPTLYSKFGDRSQVVRYINILSENRQLINHQGTAVGTHVNVGCRNFDRKTNHGDRIAHVSDVLRDLPHELMVRYFGRRPYGYGFTQGGNRWVEWKLFDSTCDVDRFKSYVHVAVGLTAFACGTAEINRANVVEALEQAYRRVYTNGQDAERSPINQRAA